MSNKTYIIQQDWLDIAKGSEVKRHPGYYYYTEKSKHILPVNFVETSTEFFKLKEQKK